jgi:hypothetical protein
MAPRFPFGRARPPSDTTERPVDVFVLGLLSGAIVGAVIAGSAIWERRHRRRQGNEPAITTAAVAAAQAGSVVADPAFDAAWEEGRPASGPKERSLEG